MHGVLAASPAGWLLVFDNAPDRASVARFVPPAGPGQVLITSRNQIWPRSQALEVPVLDLQVAAGFLVDRTGDTDRRAALELAGELGGLPLALEQAAAYVQASGDSLAGYLALFRQRRSEMLGRGEPTGYPETVATTWRLALRTCSRPSRARPGCCGCWLSARPRRSRCGLLLQPRPGPAEDLPPAVAAALAPLLDDELAAGDAVAALRGYSLTARPGTGRCRCTGWSRRSPPTRCPGSWQRQWRQAAASLIEAAIPSDPQQPDTWPTFAALLPHAQAVLDLTSRGIWQIARYLGYSGSYPAARDLFRLIADALGEDEACGPEHPDTLTARGNLARWTGRTGQAAGARDQFAALLPVLERVLGGEHPDTLTTRTRLAYWAGRAGDAAGARDQFAALVPVAERILGPEYQETLTARASLARFTGEAGDAAGARDQVAALLPVRERVLGEEHPDTLATRGNLARWTGRPGIRPAPATSMPRCCRSASESGPEHPHTLTTRANLARFTGEAGDAAGARDQFAALLPIRERILGADHPKTLTARTDLADWTRKAAAAMGAV